jgi:hypothetical protein
MQHGAKRSFCHLIFQDAATILVGVASMDYQRQAGRAGGGDVRAKTAFLSLARAVLVEVIQPRFTQRHHLWMLRQFNQFLCRNAVFLICIVRMRADGAIDVGKACRDRQQCIETFHPRGDRHNAANSRGLGAGNDGVEVVGKIRKVEMAVAVDKHRLLAVHAAVGSM